MIENFGGVIHGSKKEMAQIRRDGGLKVENASSWDMKRRNESVNRSECFPSPNYKQMYESGGYSREACFYIKKVRESLASSPSYKKASYLMREFRQAESYKGTPYYNNLKSRLDDRLKWIQNCYMDALDYFQNELLSVKTRQDINKAAFRLNDYCNRRTYKGDVSFLTPKTLAAVKALGRPETELAFLTEMDKTYFLCSSDEKLLSKYTILKYEKGMIQIGSDDISPLRQLVLKADGKISNFFDSSGKNKFFYFKNWQENTYFILDKDSGKIIENGFSSEDAAKTYITDNLKKTPKATELVQFAPTGIPSPERTGLDFLLGKDVDGDMMLDTFGIYGGQFGEWENQEERQYHLNKSFEALKDLACALGIEDKDISLGGKLGLAWGARGSGAAPAHYEHIYKVVNLTKTAGAGFLCEKWALALNNHVADVLDLKGIFATDKESESNPLKSIMSAIKYGSSYSRFYSDALKMDKCVAKYNSRSWAAPEELFARAFACYVKDKISPEKSDYLVGRADSGQFSYRGSVIYAYPRGEERELINHAFDKLISVLKENGILHQRTERPQKNLYSEKTDKTVSAFEDAILHNSPEEVNDILYQIITKIEEYDKDENVDLNKLYDGSCHLEVCTRDNMISLQKVYADNLKKTLNDCVSLNINSKEKDSLFNQINNILNKQAFEKYNDKE